MLVLTRKKNQSIMINDNVEIIIVDIKGDQVKIGVKAPRNISVHRAEVYEEIQRENLLAAQSSTLPDLKSIGSLTRKDSKKDNKNSSEQN